MQRLPRQAPGQGEAGAGDLCSLPQSYATCALGIQFVGYVMICFGAVDALCSVLFGRLARHTGRIPLFALGRRVLGGAHPAGGWGEEGGVAGGTKSGRAGVRREAGSLPEGGDLSSRTGCSWLSKHADPSACPGGPGSSRHKVTVRSEGVHGDS